MSNSIITRWKEKYRPANLDEYVGDDSVKTKVKRWLDEQDIPDLLFYGKPGTGKTSLAKIIAKHLDADLMYINASDENSIDTIRDKIKGFAATSGFSKWKLVILDEADFMSQNAQGALRNVIETYSKSTRFILTCNYVERMIDAIQSRLTSFYVHPPTKHAVAMRAKFVLDSESIQYDTKDLVAVVNQYYPDMRQILSELQSASTSGTLVVDDTTRAIAGYADKVLEELKSTTNAKDKFTNIRKIIVDSRAKNFDDLFLLLFDKLDEYAPNGKKANIIMHISEAQYRSAFVIDKEIQVGAMIANIMSELN